MSEYLGILRYPYLSQPMWKGFLSHRWTAKAKARSLRCEGSGAPAHLYSLLRAFMCLNHRVPLFTLNFKRPRAYKGEYGIKCIKHRHTIPLLTGSHIVSLWSVVSSEHLEVCRHPNLHCSSVLDQCGLHTWYSSQWRHDPLLRTGGHKPWNKRSSIVRKPILWGKR